MSTKPNQSKNNLFSIIFLLVLLYILFVTNPNEDQFKAHLKERYKKEAQKDKDLGEIKEILSAPAAWIASLSAERKNYYFFSSYKVNIFGEEETYIGVLNNFLKF
jgi:hypothetical protein